ncbi:MAG: 1-aminocyclopropane-1-carboxylate deaminase/D-cysteine desulfhydrase, partial [Cytophagales bacterium]|nr:1-aminocyclopropane-1-carboxylate deaminase/D-cysteine desulfhydrase [Cytophagales bacterium]
GLGAGLKQNQMAIGFPVLKNGGFLQNEVQQLLQEAGYVSHSTAFSLQTEYHFGGYAKWNWELEAFISRFESIVGIPIEPVYTGKLFFGLYDLIKKNHFPKGTNIVVLHTGGLRGES